MFNPFASFQRQYLAGFQKKGVRAFVMQTYPRGRVDGRPAYLLAHFTNIEWAREHYDVLQKDAHRRIFLANELTQLLVNGQAVFFSILLRDDAKRQCKRQLDSPIRTYIATRTNWRPRRDEDVSLDLQVKYGEIFVHLFYGKEQVAERLDYLDPIRHVL